MSAFLRTLCVLLSTSALYGFTLGSAHDWIYASRNLVKFPLLIAGTAVICSLCYSVIARFLCPQLTFRPVQMLSIQMFRDLSVLLASLSAPNLFLAMILVHRDDGKLGEYSLFLGLNVGFIAVSGTLALCRQANALLSRHGVTRARSRAVVLLWLGMSLVVGGQGAFYLRPLFGLPASRGQVPPWTLGTAADVRGATNFFEVVVQIFRNPPLPKSWGGR